MGYFIFPQITFSKSRVYFTLNITIQFGLSIPEVLNRQEASGYHIEQHRQTLALFLLL